MGQFKKGTCTTAPNRRIFFLSTLVSSGYDLSHCSTREPCISLRSQAECFIPSKQMYSLNQLSRCLFYLLRLRFQNVLSHRNPALCDRFECRSNHFLSPFLLSTFSFMPQRVHGCRHCLMLVWKAFPLRFLRCVMLCPSPAWFLISINIGETSVPSIPQLRRCTQPIGMTGFLDSGSASNGTHPHLHRKEVRSAATVRRSNPSRQLQQCLLTLVCGDIWLVACVSRHLVLWTLVDPSSWHLPGIQKRGKRWASLGSRGVPVTVTFVVSPR